MTPLVLLDGSLAIDRTLYSCLRQLVYMPEAIRTGTVGAILNPWH